LQKQTDKECEQCTDDSSRTKAYLLIVHARFSPLTSPFQAPKMDTQLVKQRGDRLSGPCGPSAGPPAQGLHFVMMAASLEVAWKGTSTWFLNARWFLAKLADDRNQTVNLRLIQGSSERRHIPLALIDLRVNFGVSQLFSFGGIQILGSYRFSDDRIPSPIRPVALGAFCLVQFLAVRLRCREMREGE
jgi:hypothetical protein